MRLKNFYLSLMLVLIIFSTDDLFSQVLNKKMIYASGNELKSLEDRILIVHLAGELDYFQTKKELLRKKDSKQETLIGLNDPYYEFRNNYNNFLINNFKSSCWTHNDSILFLSKKEILNLEKRENFAVLYISFRSNESSYYPIVKWHYTAGEDAFEFKESEVFVKKPYYTFSIPYRNDAVSSSLLLGLRMLSFHITELKEKKDFSNSYINFLKNIKFSIPDSIICMDKDILSGKLLLDGDTIYHHGLKLVAKNFENLGTLVHDTAEHLLLITFPYTSFSNMRGDDYGSVVYYTEVKYKFFLRVLVNTLTGEVYYSDANGSSKSLQSVKITPKFFKKMSKYLEGN